MKVAGAKNDGAWFRMNKWIKAELTDGDTKDQMAIEIAAGPYTAAMHNAFLALGAELHLDTEGVQNADAFVRQWMDYGIPRQIWNGRLSWTTYSKVPIPNTSPQKYKYVANYTSEFHHFAKWLRRYMRTQMHGRRQVNDLANFSSLGEGNPGGLPDINPTQ